MNFKGTIIITDPCYIIKDMGACLKEAGITAKYPSYDGGDIKAYEKAVREYHELTDQYDDWHRCSYGENMEVLGITNYINESTIYGDWSCTTWSTPRKDVEAQIEELNALYNKRWEAIKNYGAKSVQSEIYERKCDEATENLNKLGAFCADAGMVAVFLLDEVLQYNPDFSKWIEVHPWCVTTIRDFDGDVEYHVDKDENAHIVGKGNINFFTSQTGL